VQELRFITARLNRFVPHGFGGLFERQVPISVDAEGHEFDRVEIMETARRVADMDFRQLEKVSMVRPDKHKGVATSILEKNSFRDWPSPGLPHLPHARPQKTQPQN